MQYLVKSVSPVQILLEANERFSKLFYLELRSISSCIAFGEW